MKCDVDEDMGVGGFGGARMLHGGFATTGYEKVLEERYWGSRLDTEAGNELENTNPCVNVVRALAGHNEE